MRLQSAQSRLFCLFSFSNKMAPGCLVHIAGEARLLWLKLGGGERSPYPFPQQPFSPKAQGSKASCPP